MYAISKHQKTKLVIILKRSLYIFKKKNYFDIKLKNETILHTLKRKNVFSFFLFMEKKSMRINNVQVNVPKYRQCIQ